MDKELLSKMYSAVRKCLSISEKISKVEDIKKTIVYDILLSNLILIRDIEKKLSQNIKEELNMINWDIFKIYDDQFTNKLEFNDYNLIYQIIKEKLPELQINLENVIFTQ